METKTRDYSELDKRFEEAFKSGQRVEVTWKKGYEDYSGYGRRTDGKKARFYIGRSTGWKPVYLQIYSKRSIGGPAIMSNAIESIKYL